VSGCLCPTCGQDRPSKIGAGVVVDTAMRTVRHGDATTVVTPNEAHLVARLSQSPGRPVSTWDLVDHLYGDRGMAEPGRPEAVVKAMTWKLRQRLPAIGLQIENIYAEGYRLIPTCT
jgi:DNA-binding response OmpR family regulator